MGNVSESFIKPLLQVFQPQKAEDPAAWVAVYQTALGSFSDAALALASQRIIATRDVRSFPLPAECSIACREAIASMAADEMRAGRPDNSAEVRGGPFDQRYPEWSDRRRKRADELIQCEMGEQAAREDWIWTLWEFCRENERLPDVHETRRVRAKGMQRSMQINGAVDKVESAGDVAGLKKMREQIVGRLRRIVFAEA
jgi:hypothetical protein